MRKPFDANLIARTDKQLAAGRKRAQAKAAWSTPRTKKLPPLEDLGTATLERARRKHEREG